MSGTPTPTTPSICRQTMCPSVLSVVKDTTPSAPQGSMLFFALGNDDAVWWRRWDGSNWLNRWSTLGGPFLSQPAAVSFTAKQTNVWIVDQNFKLTSKAYKSGVWDSNWLNLDGSMTTAPSTCSYLDGSLNIFGRGIDGSLQHKNWNDTTAVGYSVWRSLGGWLTSSPVVTCAAPDRMDVVVYGRTQAATRPYNLFVRRWKGTQWGTDYQSLGGDFKGDPIAVSVSADRSDYFGIGEDLSMYHLQWTAGSGFGPLTNLGGSFESAPHAVVVSASRIDVVAVGTDDQLKHKALIERTWSPNWQDLGGSFNSAPVALVSPSGEAHVFGLANNGSLFHGTWPVGTDHDWNSGPAWTSDAGDLTLKSFRPGPIS
jgi:hypothetical protein